MNKKPLIKQKKAFDYGYTSITQRNESELDTGIEFGILKIKAGNSFEEILNENEECAYLLMSGICLFEYNGITHEAERQDLFTEDPTVLHVSKGTSIKISATTDVEISINKTNNDVSFEPIVFTKNNMFEPSEHRGQGLLDDTSYRIVRTIFDKRNREASNLVIGEVVNTQGRWSSYPPHHHPQPEIYHYRFSKDFGYGHGELGENVYKIHQFDTLKILDEQDHSQCAAPGYHMYYIWTIRHLEGNPYTVPEFTETHDWTRHAVTA